MIAQSFAYLVKTNNGKFKSEKQANFLLSKCNLDQKFIDDTPKDAVMFYLCDGTGVVSVERYSLKTGKTKKEWERKVTGILSVQDQKEIKRLRRLLAQTEETIAKRNAAFADGEYEGEESLYVESNERDVRVVKELNEMIKQLLVV